MQSAPLRSIGKQILKVRKMDLLLIYGQIFHQPIQVNGEIEIILNNLLQRASIYRYSLLYIASQRFECQLQFLFVIAFL